MAILDTYSGVTGAWSMDRLIVGAFPGAKYNTITGVSAINDQKGGGRHLTQLTAAAQPAVANAGGNLRTCANFDGVDDALASVAMSNFITGSTGYIVVVCIPKAITTNTGTIYQNDAVFTDSGAQMGIRFRANSVFAHINDGTHRDAIVYKPVINGPVFVFEWTHALGVLSLRVNGGPRTSVPAPGNCILTNLLQFGPAYLTTTFTDFYLFEAVAFNVIPSVAQQDALVADQIAHYSTPKTFANKLIVSAAHRNTNAGLYYDAMNVDKFTASAAYRKTSAGLYFDAMNVDKLTASAAYRKLPFYIQGTTLKVNQITGLNTDKYPLLIRSVDAEAVVFDDTVNVYVLEVGAPALYDQEASRIDANNASLAVTTSGSTGTIYWVMTKSRIQPTAAQIFAGQDHTGAIAIDAGTIAVASSGQKTDTATGLTADDHWMHFHQVAADAKKSNVVTAAVPETIAAPSGPTNSLITSYTPGTDRNDFTGEVGVRIGIGATPINVSWVGIRHNGYGGTRTVKLYEWFSGAVQRTVNIDLTGGVAGEYVWVPIEPITLAANGYYALLMVCTASDGQWWRNPGPVTMIPGIVNIYDSYHSGGLATGIQNNSFIGLDLGWNA